MITQESNLRLPKTHHLKLTQPFFDQKWHNLKLFELRLNDRDYQVGDTVIHTEYAARRIEKNEIINAITKPKRIETIIINVLKDYEGLKNGYCIFQEKIIMKYDETRRDVRTSAMILGDK